MRASGAEKRYIVERQRPADYIPLPALVVVAAAPVVVGVASGQYGGVCVRVCGWVSRGIKI